MNSSKKTLKLQGKKTEKKSYQSGTGKGRNIAIAIGAILLVVICVIVGYEQLRRPVIAKIDDEKVYLDDVMYYIYVTEANYDSIDQMYASFGSTTSYWDELGDDGRTMREIAKEECLNMAIQYEVLYKEAMQAGYETTDEDRESVATDVDKIMKSLTKTQKTRTGFTKKGLTEQLLRNEICNRYKQDLIDGFQIDDAGIKASINYDDYKQYEIQYYTVSTTDVSDEEKQDYLNQMNDLLEKAKKAEDFTTLVDSKDDTSVISYMSDKMIASESDFEDVLKNKIVSMKNDEISEIIQTESGYYMVKMINNNSTERYDSEVETAISDVENKEFDKEYTKIKEKYKIEFNAKEWDRIEMGNVI